MENKELSPATFVLITPVVTVKAIRWDGSRTHMLQIQEAFPDLITLGSSYHQKRDTVEGWVVRGQNQKNTNIKQGDFVVQNHHGAFTILSSDDFSSMYKLEKQ